MTEPMSPPERGRFSRKNNCILSLLPFCKFARPGPIPGEACILPSKRAESVSPALGRALFDAIARAGQPDLTTAQLDEGYAIYQSMTARGA